MIGELLLNAIGAILGWLAALLPDADLPWLGMLDDFGQSLGEHLGPIDRFLPLKETFEFLVIFLGVWCPATVVYRVAVWTYKHLPVLGKG